MTEQEAIKSLKAMPFFKSVQKYIKDTGHEPENNNTWNAIKIAISALKKQIPTNPNFESDGYSDGLLVYDTWICQNCGKHYEIDYENYEYCPNCGQHINLKWEIEDESFDKTTTR